MEPAAYRGGGHLAFSYTTGRKRILNPPLPQLPPVRHSRIYFIIYAAKGGGTEIIMNCENTFVCTAVKALDAKFGRDIQVLDLRGLTTLTDYFVIATGGSALNIQAMSDHVEQEMAKAGAKRLTKEGYDTANWVLLSYEDVIIHIFRDETREFYKLEHIWKDAPEVDISGLLIKNSAESDSEEN